MQALQLMQSARISDLAISDLGRSRPEPFETFDEGNANQSARSARWPLSKVNGTLVGWTSRLKRCYQGLSKSDEKAFGMGALISALLSISCIADFLSKKHPSTSFQAMLLTYVPRLLSK